MLQIRIHKTTILPVVLYECETWFLILREEHRLRVFGPKRDEVTGEWRILHNEELSMIKSRRMRWEGHLALLGENRCAYRFLVRKPEGSRPLRRPRSKWIILRWILER
jgi:hypothetical protein